MKAQIKIKRLKNIGSVWIVLYCTLIWISIYSMWRYGGFSVVAKVLSSFNGIILAIIPALGFFCLGIILLPGVHYLYESHILEEELSGITYDKRFPSSARFLLEVFMLILLSIVLTVIIDFIGLMIRFGIIDFSLGIIDFMISKIIAIGIGGVIILLGLISIIDRTLFRIFKSNRSKSEDS